MNEQEPADVDASKPWLVLGEWPVIVFFSVLFLLLTQNPILTGLLPYIRAGWPAAMTAFWLKRSDPWRARGTVGLLFHLCMALFRAGILALFCVVITGVAASVTRNQPDLAPFVIAICTIGVGCCLSSFLACIGMVIAFRHGVRMYVMSNLYAVCRGDFVVATTLGPGVTRTNPAAFIIGVASAVPLLATWVTVMLLHAPHARINQIDSVQMTLLISLPILIISCVVMTAFLSRRITANSPAECWGAVVPQFEHVDANWYQIED